MTIYCNVTACINRVSIDEPVQQKLGRGYTPINGMGLYDGKCGLDSISVVPKITKSSTGLRKILSVCSRFSEDAKSEGVDEVKLNCFQTGCRYHREGNICGRLNSPDGDVFFDFRSAYDGIDQKTLPVCISYSVAHRTGLIDWSRAFGG